VREDVLQRGDADVVHLGSPFDVFLSPDIDYPFESILEVWAICRY